MNGQRVIGIIFIAVLTLVSIILLIQAGRFILGSGDGEQLTDDTTEKTEQVLSIEEYIGSGAPTTFTRQGEIINNEDFSQIEIEVTPNKRELRIINGYDGTIITREAFKNTEAAYEAFMYATAYEGITSQQESVYESVNGVCPGGERHIYSIDADGQDNDLDSWSTSCSSKHGNFAGERRSIQRLFEKQIPEYRELTQDLNF